MNEHNLSEENYFSKENELKYCGSSQYKSFLKCQAATMAKLNGDWVEEPSKSLLEGSYIDAAISGTLDVFKAQHPELLKKDGTLKSEYLQAEYALSRIERDELFKKYISGDHQTIMVGEIASVPFKIKIDSYFPDKAIVDFKYVKDFEPIWDGKEKKNFVEYWGYDIQGAIYQEIVRQNTGKKLPFFIAGATKEKETDIALLSIPDEILDIKLEEIKETLPLIDKLKSGTISPVRCEHCNYCHFTKKLAQIIDYRDI